MTDAGSPGVQLWSRAATEWTDRHGLRTIDLPAFAATLMGLCPGWRCVREHLRTRNPGVSLRDIQQRLDHRAQARAARLSADSGRAGPLRLSSALVDLWSSILTRYEPRATDTAIAHEWKLMRQHADLWIGLLRAREFADILEASGFVLHELPLSPHEPQLGPRTMAGQPGEMADRYAGTESRTGSAQPDAPVRGTECCFEAMMECRDPELRRWAHDARRWSESVGIPALTTAAFAATVCYSTPLWYDYLHPRLRSTGCTIERTRAALHARARDFAGGETRPATSDPRWSVTLAQAWAQFCSRASGPSPADAQRFYQVWAHVLCDTPGSAFVRILASCDSLDRLLYQALLLDASPPE